MSKKLRGFSPSRVSYNSAAAPHRFLPIEGHGLNSDLPTTTPQTASATSWAELWSLSRRALPWLVIGLGIFLRLAQYAFNRSLWYDEANLASNIIDRSMAGLLQPLDNDQGAPIGFLLLEKGAVQAFGNSEYALRLLPFLFGSAALVLFYEVAKRYISPNAVIIALYLFALSDTLIYYSSEVKQYSSDVTVALALLLTASRISPGKPTFAQSIALGLVGAAAIWLSHPSLFVLCGIGISLLVAAPLRRERGWLYKLLIVYALWLISFSINYRVQLRYLAANGDMAYYWQDNGGFMPFPPRSIADLEWFLFKLFDLFSDPGGLKLFGLELSGIGVALCCVGAYALYLRHRHHLFLLMSPMMLTLLASALERYPFSGRLLLFMVPSLLLLLAEGAAYIRASEGARLPIVSRVLIAVLLVPLSINAAHYILHPRTREESRPAIQYIQQHRQPDDTLYVYQGAQQAFAYYSKMLDIDGSAISGVDARGDWNLYAGDTSKLQGNKRVWLLFSHVRVTNGIDEEQFLLYQLNRIGKQLDSFSAGSATAYLYDLGK
jgi:hypothetical protein